MYKPHFRISKSGVPILVMLFFRYVGICAERNAIFNMLTNGEQEIVKVLAVMPDGRTGASCGACRELMVQLMPETYSGIEIMLDEETGRVVTLGELTPEWWI